eukprot:scaffold95956_cov20-Tisochrysis_lutea.AAC.5
MRGNETGSVRSHGVQWGRRRVQSLLWVGVAMAKSECGNDVECMVIDGDKAKGMCHRKVDKHGGMADVLRCFSDNPLTVPLAEFSH